MFGEHFQQVFIRQDIIFDVSIKDNMKTRSVLKQLDYDIKYE